MDEYTNSVARVACAQLAELAGYEAVQESAVQCLAELLVKHINEQCLRAHDYAELANRTAITVNEVVLAHEDMGAATVPDLQKYLDSLTPVRRFSCPVCLAASC